MPAGSSSPPSRELSPALRWSLRLLMTAIPVLFFVLLEAGLRLGGYGQDYPLFVPLEDYPQYLRINPEAGVPFFPVTGTQPGVAETDVFLAEKPEASFRVFVLGGSSAAGYPYHYNGSFSAILREILEVQHPERRIEVVNLAMPAVSSFAVRHFARQLAPFDPDLVIVYTGHNEFYGGLGVGSSERLGGSRTLTNWMIALQRFRTVQLLQNLIASLRRSSGEGRLPDTATLMERMARERAIPFGSERFERAEAILYGNLSDVAAYCRDHDIPLLVGALVSNIRDQAPFVDVFSNAPPDPRWSRVMNRARELAAVGRTAEALEAARMAIAIDSMAASAHFLSGELRQALGDSSGAYLDFYNAKEYDGLRFRASERLNAAITRLESEFGAGIVPLRTLFEARSPGRVPGKRLFLEHVHPNLDGYALMAQAFALAIAERNLVTGEQRPLPPMTRWIGNVGVTPVDMAVADLRVAYLKSGWPFADQPPPPAADFGPRETPMELLAHRFWRNEIGWEELHVQAARQYILNDQPERAEAEYRAIIQAIPFSLSPYLFLGKVLMDQEKYGAAAAVYSQSLHVEESPVALHQLAAIAIRAGRPGDALGYAERAIARNTVDLTARLQAAQALAVMGEWERAEAHLAEVRRLRPDQPGLDELSTLIEKGRRQAQP